MDQGFFNHGDLRAHEGKVPTPILTTKAGRHKVLATKTLRHEVFKAKDLSVLVSLWQIL
jgi:hypothetical protein